MQCADQCSVRCSDHQVEPLPGTGKKERCVVAMEFPGGWSRDVLDGDTFGVELSALISEHVTSAGAGLQLIRKPGRKGRRVKELHVYVVDYQRAQCVGTTISHAAEILDLDLASAWDCTQFHPVDHPLFLICTHAKRDACCAIKGRPIAQALEDSFGGDIVWETSHMKGHRFAATALLWPWGYSFGRLSIADAARITERAHHGLFSLFANRGRGIYSPTGQVAELAVVEVLLQAGEEVHYGDLTLITPADTAAGIEQVTHRDGRVWRVSLASRHVDGVVASCGTLPKQGTVWEAVEVAMVKKS
ncbi:sucrase ferredoxin [Corynebacterium sp. 3HC-13]|uniref:sucrase ferredoxin n=1 Tax=Corynebacterium poyangense TaxID=2684405 RepID=UPI001CCD01A4|nr:sucrase ferredoxin [Corynebacterium poyangense]MBZ8176793.1 sucrase ferredoxin [Corynebacterium poyangense]